MKEKPMEYNVAVIGAGPGGYVAAIRCAQLGMSVVVIEKENVGGTCLNAGCIPTKALIKNAGILHGIRAAKKRGIIVGSPVVDIVNTIKMKDRIVSQLRSGVEMLLRGNGIEVVKGEALVKSQHVSKGEGLVKSKHMTKGAAPIKSKHVIRVGDREITCEYLIIATGSSDFIPPIPGLDEAGILTSTELLSIDHIPESLCIFGGGVIACELATVFRAFGSKVTILARSRLLSRMDEDVSGTLKKCLENDGVTIKTGCKLLEVHKGGGKYNVNVVVDGFNGSDIADSTGGEEIVEAETMLVSVGRRSNLSGLENLGLELDRGYIKVDSRMKTSVDNVFAVGDVTGKMQLAHVASAQGIIAAENIAGHSSEMSYEVVPNCVYTLPEIGSVGLTEAQAVERYGEIIVSKFPMAACGKAVAMGETEGFTKLIADRATGRLLGCHIVGPSATEIIAEAALALRNDNTLKDLRDVIHAHPTIAEAIAEAAHMGEGIPIHIL
jgi:dihydrolipoamide dehydrogenase